jgi:hypothetical protein
MVMRIKTVTCDAVKGAMADTIQWLKSSGCCIPKNDVTIVKNWQES